MVGAITFMVGNEVSHLWELVYHKKKTKSFHPLDCGSPKTKFIEILAQGDLEIGDGINIP